MLISSAMTLDGFLTFLTLVVAILALVSPTAKLRLRLGLGIQCVLAFVAIGAVLYFQFFDTLAQPCLLSNRAMCEWITFPRDATFTHQRASFIVVLLWVFCAFIVYKLSKLGPGSLNAFSRLVGSLIYEHKFAELIKLVEPHLIQFEQASKRQLRTQRVHDYFADLGAGSQPHFTALEKFNSPQSNKIKFTDKIISKIKILLSKISIFIPSKNKTEEKSNEVLRMIFRSSDLTRYTAKTEPHFAISLMRLNYYAKIDFGDSFFTELISDTGSVLYEEMRNNLNCSHQNEYFIPEHNIVLHFLFSDAQTAKLLAVYRPVGEFLLWKLRGDESPEYVRYLNRNPERFDEDRFKDPTFAGLFFFDLMVTSAAYQDIEWHMWLHYLYYIVERLENIYNTSDEGVDVTDEFPTRTARLIYECFDLLGDWVKLVRYLPPNSRHRTIKPGLMDNGNIPASAAVALARCMSKVASSPRIGEEFANSLHTTVLWDIKDLGRNGDEGKIRSYLIEQVVNGGGLSISANYGDQLASFLENTNFILRDDVKDYEAALKAKYPGVLN